jgi:hypothetical protein
LGIRKENVQLTKRKRRWLIGIGVGVVASIAGLAIAASILSRRFEPFIRDQALQYLRQRFDAEVDLAALRIHMPKMSPLKVLLRRGRGASARVEGEGISIRRHGSSGDAPLFAMKKFSFDVDLGTLLSDSKTIELVSINGMEINIPPKGERHSITKPIDPGAQMPQQNSASTVLFREILIQDATLRILPKDRTKKPLKFDIHSLKLESDAPGTPMKYQASLTNPKPPGEIKSYGSFGPWTTSEPGDTPLKGDYTFDKADLGVFSSIAGILNSTGSFEGALSSIIARGKASVPDFRLKMANNQVPLNTEFEVQVDGTNGNTILKPVKARLGSTELTTSGAVIKHKGETRRTIMLDVTMPNGDMRDILRLAMKGAPFMEGRLNLKTKIGIPPLSGKVREKLVLDGRFEVTNAKFLRSKIQDKLDSFSRRGQGQPDSEAIDEVVSGMNGRFRLDNEILKFHKLQFGVPGALVDLAGTYNMDSDNMDLVGALKLQARVSQTMTGWKRWALKPVDPFFAKQGAGTFLRIAITGPSKDPHFGLARGRDKQTRARHND